MSSNKNAARIAGGLFITATVAGLLSTSVLNPLLNDSAYLVTITAHQNQLTTGALLQVIMGFACAGIAISLYPILRSHNTGLALGAVGFRLIEGMLDLVSAIGALLLLTLAQEFAKAGASDPSSFQGLGALVLAFRDQANLMGVLTFYLGAFMYYYVFYRSRLIPRWLSAWGVIGVTLGMAAGLLVLFGVTTSMSTLQVVLNVPIGVQEMVLAVWLIVRGVASPAIGSGSVKTERTSTPVLQQAATAA